MPDPGILLQLYLIWATGQPRKYLCEAVACYTVPGAAQRGGGSLRANLNHGTTRLVLFPLMRRLRTPQRSRPFLPGNRPGVSPHRRSNSGLTTHNASVLCDAGGCRTSDRFDLGAGVRVNVRSSATNGTLSHHRWLVPATDTVVVAVTHVEIGPESK